MVWESGNFAGKSHEGAAVLYQPSSLIGLFGSPMRNGYAVICGGDMQNTQLAVYDSKEAYASDLVQSCVYGYRLCQVPLIMLTQSIRVGDIVENMKTHLFSFEIIGIDGIRPFKDKLAGKDEQALRKLHHAIKDVLKMQAKALSKKSRWTSMDADCIKSKGAKRKFQSCSTNEELSLVSRDIGALNGNVMESPQGGCLSPSTYQQL
jgi:hypothetical protein